MSDTETDGSMVSDRWGGLTQYRLDGEQVVACHAYWMYDGDWSRVELTEEDRVELSDVSDVPDGWQFVGIAENHPDFSSDTPDDDRAVVAVFAPFEAHEWGCVELPRAEAEPMSDGDTDE
jgi:hypothetical protein